jgi:hypothetical protein
MKVELVHPTPDKRLAGRDGTRNLSNDDTLVCRAMLLSPMASKEGLCEGTNPQHRITFIYVQLYMYLLFVLSEL